MLPNFRLMIAAICASVVVLVCGFGMFAALRVNHEPLVHLAPATAPLQLAADNAATPSTVVAAAEPFDRRFQISPPQSADDATNSLMRQRDRRDGVAPAPAAAAVAPEPGDAAAEETAAVGGPSESAASPAARPIEEPVVKTVKPTVDDRALGASEPEPAPAAAGDADAPPSSQETAAAPGVAAIEPPADQKLPAEQTKPESELVPASITKAAPEAAHKTVRKARRTRVAARTHHARGHRTSVVSNSSTQNNSFTRPNFQTAPQASQTQWAQKQHHRSKFTSATNAKPNSAAGGPFVSPPSQ